MSWSEGLMIPLGVLILIWLAEEAGMLGFLLMICVIVGAFMIHPLLGFIVILFGLVQLRSA